MYIGAVVKELRAEKGITQQELAEFSSLSTRTIQLIEGDLQEPKLSTLFGLAQALGVDLRDFVDRLFYQPK